LLGGSDWSVPMAYTSATSRSWLTVEGVSAPTFPYKREGQGGAELMTASGPCSLNLREAFSRFMELWSTRIIAGVNDYDVKLARVLGVFTRHTQPDTDPFSLVVDGGLRNQHRTGAMQLGPGDVFVVPRGIEHSPSADQETQLLLLEPRGTVNTGDAGGAQTW